MVHASVLVAVFLLLYVECNNGLKVLTTVKESCKVLTDQGTVDLTPVAKPANRQAAA